MKQNSRILISIALCVIGFILNGLAWSTIIGRHPYNTICFSLGLGLSFFGFVFFIRALIKK